MCLCCVREQQAAGGGGSSRVGDAYQCTSLPEVFAAAESDDGHDGQRADKDTDKDKEKEELRDGKAKEVGQAVLTDRHGDIYRYIYI